METQLVIVCALVALAVLYLLRSTWQTWFGATKSGCGSGCGSCSSKKSDEENRNGRIPLQQV